MRVYVVHGCKATAQRFFEFPKDQDRFLTWIAASGNESLIDLSLPQLKKRTLCQVHFEDKYFLSKKLIATAVPTLNLPEKINVSKFVEKHFTQQVQPAPNLDPEYWPTPAQASLTPPTTPEDCGQHGDDCSAKEIVTQQISRIIHDAPIEDFSSNSCTSSTHPSSESESIHPSAENKRKSENKCILSTEKSLTSYTSEV